MGKSTICKQRAFRQSSAVAENQFLDLAFDLLEGGFEYLPARIDHNGPLGAQSVQANAQGFAHAAPDAIPGHGVAEGARSREPDPRSAWLSEAEGREESTRDARSVVVDSAKILRPEQTNTFRETSIAVAKDLGNYLSELTVSFLRPRARRREITARPSAVFILVRKPCFLARLRLFGWKVRLGISI
jgi:hypothetical protein